LSLSRSWRTAIRAVFAVASGAVAYAGIGALALAYYVSGPEATVTWTIGKAAVILIGTSAIGSLAAGGRRGLQGFVSGLMWLGAGLGALAISSLGIWAVILFGLLSLPLSVVIPGMAVAAGLDGWRRPA